MKSRFIILKLIITIIIIMSCIISDGCFSQANALSDRKASTGLSSESEKIRKIRVVMDNNYPPFIFIDSDGKKQGILIEQWKLWEEKTGISVEIDAVEWHKALELMEAGKYDVIDTIFFNDSRALLFDFTPPYARIDVPVFFNRKISGISGADTVRGFAVAVKKGDNAVNILMQHGVENLIEFDSYEEIAKQARNGKVTVFVIDAPPAFYFLYKMGIQDEFNYSKPLYTGAFHRAVKKGNRPMLELVNAGFSRISESDYEKIDRKWYGSSSLITKDMLVYAGITAVFFILALLLLFLWNRTLKKQVRLKTKALEDEIEEGRRKAEALLQSEETLRSAIESMDDLIFIFDSENRFTGFHQPLKNNDLLFPPEFFMGKKIDETGLPENTVNGYMETISKIRKTGRPAGYEYSLCINGVNRWFSARLSARKNNDNGFSGVTAAIRDITDKKNLEAEREKILSDLELKNIELEKIIYTASHDLRSPLLNLHGFSKRLEKAVQEIRLLAYGQENGPNNRDYDREAIVKIIDEKINNSLKYIISGVSRIDTVINGLLRISRSGNRMPVKSSLDMNSLVEKILDSMRYQIETSGTDIRVDDLPGCMADFGQITQVFSNILDNAIKYRDPERQSVITVKGTAENGIARYSISDNGIGIAQENHNRIWEMFHRINPGNEIPGDGLGLAISKKIIDRHGGSIYLESEPGRGSTFYVCIEYAGVQ